jgi:hypothetical protein
MGPREEDNGMLLLAAVTLICATLAGVVEIGRPGPVMAARPEVATARPTAAAPPTVVASDVPVRVILPFTPNTTPSAR